MNGILLINKEKNYTSRDVVNKVSKILNTKKVGHTGTLDPNATGVLVLCIENATKIIELITNYDKEYIGEVILGIETDTLDITGNIIKKENVNVIEKDIKNVLKTFIGKSKQQVPIYSSVKINGKKLYEYARKNEKVDLPVRQIEIKELEMIDDIYISNDTIRFKIRCVVSKGTYIRSLCYDIGQKLGVPSCMGDLIRTKVGNYRIEDSYTLEDVMNNNYEFIDINTALSNYPFIKVNDEMKEKIKHGMVLDRFFDPDIAVLTDKNDQIISIYKTYEKDNTKVKPFKMFI